MSRKIRSPALLFIGLLLFAIPDHSSASLPRKRILILFPYESNTPGFVNFDDGFRSTLRSSEEYEFEFFVEAMDLARFPDERYHQRLMEFLHDKYSGITIDLVVAIQLPSFDLLIKHSPQSFRNVPVILYSQDRRMLGDPKSIPGAAVVTDKLDIKGILDLAIRLHPGANKVFVISGASRFDRLLESIAREEFRSFESQVRFQYLSGLPMHELIHRVSLLSKDSLVFYLAVLRDGSGRSYKSPEALALISRQASAPIYSVSETYIDSGIVGGHLISHAAHGAMVGRVALRILAGEDPEEIGPPEESINRYIFDARELKRWGISESKLPPGSDVRYRDFSVWETYRWQIVGVASLLIIQAILISNLVISLRKRRRAERALQKAADEWQTTFDSTTDLIMLLDDQYRIVQVNAAVVSFFGLPREQIVGKHCHSVMHGSGSPPNDCPCARMLETKGHEEAVLYDTKRDAWLLVSVDPILDGKREITGVVHTVRNVTEKKHAEEAIQASEEFNRAVLASLKNHVAILDKNGTILAVNEAWEQFAVQSGAPSLTGLGPGVNYLEFCRRSIQEPADFAGQALNGILSVLDGKRDAFALEYPCDLPSESRWFSMKVMPFRHHGGGIVISHSDITQRKNAELEAQLRREELTHLTRIVTIGELATSLAHEINQPMTAILCNAEAAQRFLSGDTPDLEEVRTILDDIIQDDRRAGEVIKRIRTLVKKEMPHREKVDLNDAVWETITLVRSASFLDGLSIVTELDSELPTVQGDRVQLQQVILNLLLNATAAMRETPPALRRLVVRTAMQDRRAVMVSVKDSGTGIDQNFMDRPFEPFYTTKPDGLGMGLAISRTIIKAHGGTIWAENNEEGGATFTFTLPLDSGEQP